MAAFLANKMQAEKMPVIYPGLATHSQHELLKSVMNKEFGFGGILTMECADADQARRFATLLQDEKFGLYAVSLGFSRTLMSCSAKSTSSEIPEEEQKEIGLAQGLLRFSIGYMGDPEIMWDRFIKSYKKIIA
jgi:methionine-gamma-lyase